MVNLDLNDVRELDWVAIGLLVMAVLLVGTSFWVATIPPEGHDYEYQIKTEQVQSDSHSIDDSEVIQYKDLTGAEKDAVYEAYKESDSFLSGSSVYIDRDEPLNLEEDSPNWMVVEIEGVRLLVGIVLIDKSRDPSPLHFFGMIIPVVLGLLSFAWAVARREENS